MGTKKTIDQLKQEINSSDLNGLSVRQIAARWDLTYHKALKLAREHKKDFKTHAKDNYTAAEKRAIAQGLYRSTQTTQEWAKEKGIPYTTLRAWVKEKLPEHQYKEILTRTKIWRKTGNDGPAERAEDLYTSGYSIQDFALKRGYPHASVARWSRERLPKDKHQEILNRKTVIKTRRTREDGLAVLKDLLAHPGMSMTEYANKNGRPYHVVRSWAKELLTPEEYIELCQRGSTSYFKKGTPPEERRRLVKELYDSTDTLEDFATRNGIKTPTLNVWVKDILTTKQVRELRQRGKRKYLLKEDKASIAQDAYLSKLSILQYLEEHPSLSYHQLNSWLREYLSPTEQKEIRIRNSMAREELQDGAPLLSDQDKKELPQVYSPSPPREGKLPPDVTRLLLELQVVIESSERNMRDASLIMRQILSL